MNSQWKHKFQMYKHLQISAPQMYAAAQQAGSELGITPELRHSFGLTAAISGNHGLLTSRISDAMDRGARQVVGNAVLDERVREIVKDVYGDEWDAACINTCEAALWVTFDTLFSPPFTGRGDAYRARYVAPYERHLHHQGGYGRPFPPRYKDLFADRGATAGELGLYGKRLSDVDVVFVPLKGARYDCHGIKYHPTPLLTNVDVAGSDDALKAAADRHSSMLTGFTSLGYDTPGYGYAAADQNGARSLQARIGQIAANYSVPYVVDNAWGTPFLGTDPRLIGADVIVYSMDKAVGAPTAGLIIGREEPMQQIRRALGIHGERWGTVSSHGKAAYVTNDPGKEALLGVIATLEALRDEPDLFTTVLDEFYDITLEEFEELPPSIREDWVVTKSVNSLAIELNYENTWKDERFGIPIFTIEDLYAGSNVLQNCIAQMGVIPTITYDANILISPGLGTTDEDGRLIKDRARLAAQATMRAVEIVCEYAGLLGGKTAGKAEKVLVPA